MTENTKNNQVAGPYRKLFYQGRYSEILQSHERNPKALQEKEIPFLIGALSFLGKTFEAEEVYRHHESSFSDLAKSASLFWIGVGFTRKSNYKKARALFRRNQLSHAKNENPEIAFYAFQGVAFYLYFTGQFFRCQKFATQALRLAVRAHNSYIKFLAQDLLAHTMVQTGNVYEGIELLRGSHALAKNLQNEAFISATNVTLLLYEAQHGHRPSEIIEDLEKCLRQLTAQDSYSQSNVVLELAQQKTLRGQWSEAEELLNAQAPVIFFNENRRQEIILNLRWAEIAYLRGHNVLAWQFLRGAHLRLHQEADKNFAVQILNLEIKILEDQKSPLVESKKEELLKLSRTYSSKIHRHILARKQWISSEEDSEGDLIQSLLQQTENQPEKSLQIMEESGYFSWLYKFVPLKKGQDYIVLGTRMHFTVSEDGVRPLHLTGVSQKILEVLRQGSLNKSELVEKVWGYEYHPLRHDSLVYAAMSALRKNLGKKYSWIQTSDSGYQLAEDLTLLYTRSQKIAAPVPQKRAPTAFVDAQLNYRQLQALDYLQENRFLNTRQYKDLFKTTEITACRDLAALKKRGYVLQVGYGRATQYTLLQGEPK